MEAKELMTGDWVTGKKWRENPFKLTRINDNGKYYYGITFDGTQVGPFLLEELEPVPLTSEILEKNGFEDIGDDTYQLEEKPYWFWVDFFNHQYGCEYDTSTHEYEDDEHRLKLYGIPSVHQLQHAMRICGIEKTIEL